MSNEAVKRLTAEVKEMREEATRAKEPELFTLANGLLRELQQQQLQLKVIDSSTMPPLKALLTLLGPDAKKDMPTQPKKADWVERVKLLLGGEGAPKFNAIMQKLASKELAAQAPVAVAIATPVIADAQTAAPPAAASPTQ